MTSEYIERKFQRVITMERRHVFFCRKVLPKVYVELLGALHNVINIQ